MNLFPCSVCDRHLRDSDRLCPFCGAAQSLVASPSLGALTLAVALLGSTACTSRPISSDGTSDGSSETSTSETETTATTDASTGDGDGDGDMTNTTFETSGSFYAVPTDMTQSSLCDPFAQDCPDGEKCVPVSGNGDTFDANKCVPITGDGQPGEACIHGGIIEGTDDCGENSHCWGTGDTGVCTEFCTGTFEAPICPMGIECLLDSSGFVNLCVTACDPLLQPCAPDFACYWVEPQFTCLPSGDVPLGAVCESVDDCALGLTCLTTEVLPACAGDSCCTGFCDLLAPSCPEMGTECVAFFDRPPEGHEDVGLCMLP